MKVLPLSLILLLAACSNAGDSAVTNASAPWPPGTVVDLSHAFGDETLYWPTAGGFEKTTDFEGMTEGGWYYSAYTIRTAEHGGTHLDAPVHFAEGRNATDEIPLDRLMGPAVVVDVSESAGADRDYLVTTADFEAWEARNGRIPDGAIVLLRTGFGRYWPDAERYMGTARRGADAVPLLHFPGLDRGAAAWLVAERDVDALGIDTPSIDRGQSTMFEAHRILFAENIPALENVANLDRLPEIGAYVIALPMKIAGGSGGPLRIIAVIPPGSG
jgi:kynurenine formamidase